MSDTAYRGAHRHNLDDDTDLEAMELAEGRREAPAPEVEGEPPPPTKPPADAAEATFAKRYADLRRHAAQNEARLKAELEAARTALDKAAKQSMQLPSNEAEIEAWTKEFPDVARIVNAIAARQANERVGETEKRIQAAEAREREAAKRAAVAELLRIHPDFNELRADPAFHDWAGQQPKWVQSALYDDLDPRAAARAIDLYKLDTQPVKRGPGRPPKEEAAAGVAPTRRQAPDPAEGKRTFRESEIAKMRPQQYEALEDAIMEARREGRFVYDLQGAG